MPGEVGDWKLSVACIQQMLVAHTRSKNKSHKGKGVEDVSHS